MKPSIFRVAASLALLLLAACSEGGKTSGSAPANAQVGAQAPAWNERTAMGSMLSSSQYLGKPIYMNFFASWCPPCNDEAPSINAIAKKYAPQGLVVIGVDELENERAAEGFAAKYHLVYPALVDKGALRDAYNINGMPVHVFIKRDGTIARMVIGEMSPSEIDAAVRAIL